VASDCASIQALIDAAGPGPSVVRVPPGNYTCREPVIIQRNDISIEGQGVNLKLADNANAPVMIIGSPHTKWMKHPQTGVEDFYTVAAEGSSQIKVVRNVRVSGFNIDGNKDNQSFECWTARSTLPPRKAGEAISNSTCSGEGPSAIRNNGITIRGAEDIQVSDVVLDNNASGGMVTEKHIKRLRVQRMKARNNWFDGFAGYQTEDSSIEDSELSNNQGAGASLDLHFNNNTFLRTKFSDNGHQGVFARELSGNKWIDSEISCNGYQGVFLASSHSGEVDTAALRIDARKAGHVVGTDLKIPLAYFEQLLVQENKNPSGKVPLDELKKRAAQYKKPVAVIFQEMYDGNVLKKIERCANNNSFMGTKIACSGAQTPSWGAGIRINDDECLGTCIDASTASMLASLSGKSVNQGGDITVGTLGAIDIGSAQRCGKLTPIGVNSELKKEQTHQ